MKDLKSLKPGIGERFLSVGGEEYGSLKDPSCREYPQVDEPFLSFFPDPRKSKNGDEEHREHSRETCKGKHYAIEPFPRMADNIGIFYKDQKGDEGKVELAVDGVEPNLATKQGKENNGDSDGFLSERVPNLRFARYDDY